MKDNRTIIANLDVFTSRLAALARRVGLFCPQEMLQLSSILTLTPGLNVLESQLGVVFLVKATVSAGLSVA